MDALVRWISGRHAAMALAVMIGGEGEYGDRNAGGQLPRGRNASGINNVYAFSQGKAGRVMLGAPNAPDPGLMPALSELRAFVVSSDGSFLFVANGSKDRNQVVRFTAGSTGEPVWVFHDVYASEDRPPVRSGPRVRRFPVRLQPGQRHRHVSRNGGRPGDDLRHGVQQGPRVGLRRDVPVRRRRRRRHREHLRRNGRQGRNPRREASGAPAVRLQRLAVDRERARQGRRRRRHRPARNDDDHHDAVYAYDTAKAPAGDVVKVVPGEYWPRSHGGPCLVAGPTTKSATLLVASRVGHCILAYPIDLSHHSPSWSPQTSKTVLGSDVLLDDPEFIALTASL